MSPRNSRSFSRETVLHKLHYIWHLLPPLQGYSTQSVVIFRQANRVAHKQRSGFFREKTSCLCPSSCTNFLEYKHTEIFLTLHMKAEEKINANVSLTKNTSSSYNIFLQVSTIPIQNFHVNFLVLVISVLFV